MLTDWKLWIALLVTIGPLVLRFVPYTAPFVAALLQTRFGRTLALVLLVIAALLFGASWFESRGYDRGVQKTQERIEQQDKRALDRADEAARKVQECYDQGRLWDQTTGRCAR